MVLHRAILIGGKPRVVGFVLLVYWIFLLTFSLWLYFATQLYQITNQDFKEMDLGDATWIMELLGLYQWVIYVKGYPILEVDLLYLGLGTSWYWSTSSSLLGLVIFYHFNYITTSFEYSFKDMDSR